MQAFKALDSFLSDKLASLTEFRTAQLAWASQLEVLYQTPAYGNDSKEQLRQLNHCCQLLLQLVQRIEVRALKSVAACKGTTQFECGKTCVQ